jgi:hypothetical protein
MDNAADIFIVIAALFASMILAGVLLTRARSHAKPESSETEPEAPASASRRQRRILKTMTPNPQIPTLMDLVRQEIAELGIEDIPGHEDIAGPVLLKVFRRDHELLEQCPHGTCGYVVAEGVRRDEADEQQVRLFCEQCAGTDPRPETLNL